MTKNMLPKPGINLRRLEWVWKDTWHEVRVAQIPLAASSLAYTTILSVVPLLAVSFAIFHAFGGLDKLSDMIRPLIIRYLAQSSSDEAMKTIDGFIQNIHAGAVGVSGFIALIVTTMAMLFSAEKAINRVWQTKITRPWFQRVATYWFFITLGPLAAAIALGAASSAASANGFALWSLLPSGTAIFVGSMVFLFLVYKWVPNRHVNWVPAAAASVFTAILLGVARALYGLYTSHVLTYNKIYGGLAAVPIILVWIYIGWAIVLTGAAFSAALQRRFDLT